MIVKPNLAELLQKVPTGKYSLVIGTAKRARQIAQGSPKLTKKEAESDVTTAAYEINEGAVILQKEPENEK